MSDQFHYLAVSRETDHRVLSDAGRAYWKRIVTRIGEAYEKADGQGRRELLAYAAVLNRLSGFLFQVRRIIAQENLSGRIASGERAPRSLEAETIIYRKHLATLGKIPVRNLTPERVSALLARLRSEGYKPSTIVRIYSVLRSLLNLAVTRGLIPESPLKRLDSSERPESGGESRGRCLTDDECSRLIAHALPGSRVLTAFYAFTGVRQSEGLAVRWGDLELDAGTVTISAQLSRPKRGEPARRVPLKTARAQWRLPRA